MPASPPAKHLSALAALFACLLLLAAAQPALAEWGGCDDCHQGIGGPPGGGFPYGVCAHCHHQIDYGPIHDPDDPGLVCANCHTPSGCHYVHHWEEACQECHGPVHVQGPHIYEVTPEATFAGREIDILGGGAQPNTCYL